jgi:ATP-dependent RNA helicase DHX37/DHR1
MYSGACFGDQFQDFAEPEILRNPIEDTVLQMKSMSISNIIKFPFPTPPDKFSLSNALKTLVMLGKYSMIVH